MYFDARLVSDKQREGYRRLLGHFGEYLDRLTRRLVGVFEVAREQAGTRGRRCDGTILMLARHFLSSADGVSVLAAQGCSEPCIPLLRTAFEACLGLGYIVRDDHDRRALAYQVAHVHRLLSAYHRFDPEHKLGRELRAELDGDENADVIDSVPFDFRALAARLEPVLRLSDFAPIEAEWQAVKGRKGRGTPEWFSLFQGPKDVKALAKEMGQLTAYWFLYKQWSTVIHAGAGMESMATKDNAIVIRPLRHPEEVQSVVRIISGCGVDFGNALLSFFRPDLLADFQEDFACEFEPGLQRLIGDEVQFPGWR
jgi:hypothetical protein